MGYFRERRIKKLRIKIAGLHAKALILTEIVNKEHTSFDREDLVRTWTKYGELVAELKILTNKNE